MLKLLNKTKVKNFLSNNKILIRLFCDKNNSSRYNPEHIDHQVKKIRLIERFPEKIQTYLKLGRFDRPVGYLLLFIPCTWGLTLSAASVSPLYLKYIGLTFLGAVLMRSSGCVINDMWDKDIDKQVIRSQDRPLASGKLTFNEALAFLSVKLAISLYILCQFPLNSIICGLSIMPIVIIYPYMKRITYIPQLFLGLCFNSGVLVGYTTFMSLDYTVALPFYLGGVLWTLIYDTIYAHMDKVDDKTIGVKSTALLFNKRTKVILGLFTVLMTGLFYHGLRNDEIKNNLRNNLLTDPAKILVLGSGLLELFYIYSVNLDSPLSCLKYFKLNIYPGYLITLACLFRLIQKQNSK
jgi:4-hydroxybenzoate polyprenyltransferase